MKMFQIRLKKKKKTAEFPFNEWQDADSSTVSYKHVSAPGNTLSIFGLNRSDCRPTEVIWTFITFPRVSFLSELVSFHSHLHRCWRIWIIHAFCVIYVFAYSWRHECVCAVSPAAGEVNEDILWVHGGRWEAFFFFFWHFLDCNSVMKLDSVQVIIAQKESVTNVRCMAASRTEEALFCLLSSSLTDWMSPSFRHFNRKTKQKKQKKRLESQSLRPGLPSATITNLIYCLVLWQQAETDGE